MQLDLEKQNTPVEITRERPLPRRKGGGSRNGGGRRDGNRGGGYRGNRNRRGNGDVVMIAAAQVSVALVTTSVVMVVQ